MSISVQNLLGVRDAATEKSVHRGMAVPMEPITNGPFAKRTHEQADQGSDGEVESDEERENVKRIRT
jgi:hypothetical protein